MAEKPATRAGYSPEKLELVRQACLYVATVLGDLSEHITIVGGLVPSLLLESAAPAPDMEAHAGTLDLDLGLSTAVFDARKYQELAERLRQAGFRQDSNAQGRSTRQRWRVEAAGQRVTVDFLIPPTRPGDVAGRLRNLEKDFAAILIPGLKLAFEDRLRVLLEGQTLHGEWAQRAVWVCGPGAFIVLKALAFESRGTNKDAYDLYFIVRNYGQGPEDVARCLMPLLHAPEARQAVDILKRDFLRHDALGPMRVARFLYSRPDDEIQADVVGFISQLLARLK